MNLSEICIKRPVFTIVMSLVLLIIGAIYYERLPIQELPEYASPVITVMTEYPGASPELIENALTAPLENVLTDINGLQIIRSESRLGRSRIMLIFSHGTNINHAMEEIRNILTSWGAQLPSDAKQPLVMRSDDSADPVLVLSISDPNKSTMEISDYANRYLRPQLQQIPGVSTVEVWGERRYAIRIWLDPFKMAAYGITAADVNQALREQNINIPSGQIKSLTRDFSIVTNNKLDTADEFKALIITQDKNKTVKLSDIARIEVGPEDIDKIMRVDGKPATGLGIIPHSTANPVEVAEAAEKRLAAIKANLPPGMKLQTIFNSSVYIEKSIHEVFKALFEAFLLVIAVIFLFLGSMRSASIPIVTIPVCLIAVFWPMHLLGYSINTVTLMGLVLAIGLVVDDAIVMLENIYRHIEAGMQPFAAAVKGSKEISFAIIAMTLTLAAVYLPAMFMTGFVGAIFQPFAVTLALTVVVSGFVALTLSPMMCARLLGTHKDSQQETYISRLHNGFNWLNERYKHYLHWQLVRPKMVLIIVIGMGLLGYIIYCNLPQDLAPVEDTGIIAGGVSAPTDASVRYTDSYVKQLEKIYAAVPEQEHTLYFIGKMGGAKAQTRLILKPWEERKLSQEQVISKLRPLVKQIPGIDVNLHSPTSFGSSSSGTDDVLSVQVMSNGSYQELSDILQVMVEAAKQFPGLLNPKSSLQLDSQRYHITIDRKFAANLQVDPAEAAETIATMLGGKTPAYFEYDGQRYNVITQMQPHEREDLKALDHLYVRSKTGKMIPLSSFVSVTATNGPTTLPHYNRMRSAIFSADLAPDYPMGTAIQDIQQIAKQVLPENAQYAFVGAAKQFLESSHDRLLIFVLALVFIYLVLAAQFESFRDPFIILLSVPLCIIGGLVSLQLIGGSLNIYSNIALVTLIGLIAKHGILITEFANQLKAQGKALQEAVIEAAALRLRPILMTTAAMVLGALPLALASGAGAHARQQIGWVIVGGMLVGTFFSLIVVPVAYLRLKHHRIH